MALHTLCFGELVNLTANESSEELLGESMVHDIAFGRQLKGFTDTACGGESSLTLFALVVLVELEALEGSSTGHELMGELGFVVRIVVASALAIYLLVSVLRVT